MTNVLVKGAIAAVLVASGLTAYAAPPPDIQQRIDEKKALIKERLDAAHQRVCDRLSAIHSRIGKPLPLPPFCDGNGGGDDDDDDAPSLTFAANPATIALGASSTLTWDSTDADECTASNGWSGGKTVDGSQSVSPATTTTYTLGCHNENGTTSKSVTVTVTGGGDDDPPALAFAANPSSITEGASSTLTWDSTDADSCTASNGWSGNKSLDGNQSVSPATTTTYTLSCSNENGTTTDSETVTVTAATGSAPLLSFTASSSTIPEGGTSTLAWDSTNADTCVASNGWSGSKPLDGNENVSPTTTTTYTLSCGNEFGTTTDSEAVTVTPASTTTAPTLTFDANPNSITEGASTTLTWSSTDADSCTASDGWAGAVATSGTTSFAPTTTTTYTLMCSGPGGTTSPQSEVVTVTPAATGTARIVISEVLYDPRSSTSSDNQGEEPGNEWIELYNAGNAAATITNWWIGDDSASVDQLPTFTLMPGQYAFVTMATSTKGLWSIPGGAVIIELLANLGNGLGNTNDSVRLLNSASSTVDAVSWGTSTIAFTPGVADAPEGSSLFRVSPGGADTNTAADWDDDPTPTPGE